MPYLFGMDPGGARYYRPDETYGNCGHTRYVKETFPRYSPDDSYLQLLYFEDVASTEDPYERLTAENARMKEIAAWSGVEYVSPDSYGCFE